MESPYDNVIAYLRMFHLKEKKHYRELDKEKELNKYYISFKQGKLYAIQIAIENVTRLKNGEHIPDKDLR